MKPGSFVQSMHCLRAPAFRALCFLLVCAVLMPAPAPALAATTLLSADFNADANGFTYQDDAFGTSQPTYADGTRTATGGFNGGGLQVTLGGVNANTISNMSGGWTRQLSLSSAQPGIRLSFRYKLQQSATYEFDEYSQARAKVDDVEYGRGAKSYVDHIGGDGSSSQGNSSSFLPTTEWQLAEIFVGTLEAGAHTITLGGFNNKKDATDEATTLVIDDVIVTAGNAAPTPSAAQVLAGKVDYSQYLNDLRGLAQFHDRCRGSGMSCSSTDYTTNYMNALAWVEQQLQDLGYTTVRHSFNYNGNTGTNLWATKVGTVTPTQMYIVGGHLDGRGAGDGFDDDGSGVALALETARVLAGADVTTDKSIRFCFWDKEEVGLYGAYGYVQDRRSLQGTVDEPTWLGMIQHDMVLYDHGAGTRTTAQSAYADLDVEWRAGTAKETDSKALALAWAFANGSYAPDYPATAYNYSTNTDDTPFQPYVAAISVRENRRSLTSGSSAEWINPNYHTVNDIESAYTRDDDSDGKRDDIELGVNAVQTTLGLVAELAGVHIAGPNTAPTAYPQTVSGDEDDAISITLSASDADNEPLTYQVHDAPAHGVLAGTLPSLTYTPAANYTGPDIFTFSVSDGEAASSAASVRITVEPVNDAPVANPQTVSTACNTPLPITLSASDPDGDPLIYRIESLPALGIVEGAQASLIYTPAPDTSGADVFSFTASDGLVTTALTQVAVNTSTCTVLALPFSDDFEVARGWQINRAGSDTATAGAWERNEPSATDENGPKQPGFTPSGTKALVTRAAAGEAASSGDVDGGVTSVSSPAIQLPTGQDITLSLRYSFAHNAQSSPADFFRVKVAGTDTVIVLDAAGSNADVDAAWTDYQVSLNDFAGQQIRVVLEAADLAGASLVEATVDDVHIVAAPPATPLLTADFDSEADGFSYADDAFRGTTQPQYADGAYAPTHGRAGGALQVTLGGQDDLVVMGMSGGWSRSFSLPTEATVTVSFWHRLTQSADYEGAERSEVLLSIDGVLCGAWPTDYLATLAGDGNGGASLTTGWRLSACTSGPLAAGSHTLALGGYGNSKSQITETTEVLIDEIVVTAE